MKRRSLSYLSHWVSSASRKPLILRGARQVGKSTLVRHFAETANLRLVEINFEKELKIRSVFETLDATKILAALEAHTKTKISPEESLIFFDEIQACPTAIAALRYFYEECPQYKVVAAGSLLEFALTESKLSMPVGRVTHHHLGPMNFEEFLMARGEDYLLDQLLHFDLGVNWPESLHDHLLNQVRTYMVVGGMPEVVKAFIGGAGKRSIREIQQNLIALYSDDFGKYATRTELAKLQKLYMRLPLFIGKKVKYAQLLPDERSQTTAHLLHLLEKAGIARIVHHSDCSGIPLAAQTDFSVAKPYWLDCGLLHQMLGLAWDDIDHNERLLAEGLSAEQFVAQELLAPDDSPIKPGLYYWLREKKSGNAEVDFVIQKSTQIIPIEVKAGKIGRIKSLLYMLGLKDLHLAIRVAPVVPSFSEYSYESRVEGVDRNVHFQLLECPPYLVGQIRRLHFPERSKPPI